MTRRITPAVAETEVPKTNANDFFSALNSTVVSSATKEKKDKISVLTPEKGLRQTVDEYVEWKNREKEAKAEKELEEATFSSMPKKFETMKGLMETIRNPTGRRNQFSRNRCFR